MPEALFLHSVAGPDLTARQLHDLLRLRVDVFVVEQECPYHEIDGRDLEPTTTHLWHSDDDGITTSLRVLSDPLGWRFGRVVTRSDVRGRGLSKLLMESALVEFGSVTTVLDGQSYLRSFYEGFGYEVTGPEYVEDGIPHFPMQRSPMQRSPMQRSAPEPNAQ